MIPLDMGGLRDNELLMAGVADPAILVASRHEVAL